MAGQNVKALGHYLTAKTEALCAYQHPPKAPMFLTIIKTK